MDKGLKILITIIVLMIIGLFLLGLTGKKSEENNKKRILTSFYPIYVMTLNITDGVENVETSNMAENFFGCIHDYTLTTDDLKKVEDSNIFIQSGNGLEPFTEKVIQGNKNIQIISCANNIEDLIENDEGEQNVHTWLSIKNYKEELKEIAEQLSKNDIKNEKKYQANLKKYISKLDELELQYKDLKSKIIKNNQKAICLDESLEYILKENGIEETTIETDHEQSSLSAEQVKEIIEKMKNEKINSIFIAKNNNTKTAELLEKETGAKIYKLNSGMSGKADKDDYLNIMKENFEVLKQLGE